MRAITGCHVLLVTSLATGCEELPGTKDTRTLPTTTTEDPTTPASCSLPAYGDGVCNVDLACDEPDIDCFLTFDTQEEAETWFAGLEAQIAEGELRDPRPIVPASDPRWADMRTLLDDGWAAYVDAFPVGDLIDASPALILVDDPTTNAFVMPVSFAEDQAAFAVMVHTGLLQEDLPEEAWLGLMMHELEHALSLHVVAGVSDAMLRFYVAPEGEEPIGLLQEEDPTARAHGDIWRAEANNVGSYSYLELAGMPTGGLFQSVLVATLVPQIEQSPDRCRGPADDLNATLAAMYERVDPLDASITFERNDPLTDQIEDAFASLRDDCMTEGETEFLPLFATSLGVSEADLVASLPAEAVEVLEGLPFMDGLAEVTIQSREAMVGEEVAFEANTSLPWSRLRFYSEEEAADDVTVPVLERLGYDPTGLGLLLNVLIPLDARDDCQAILDAGEVPGYGVDLLDTHHANCWRIHHLAQLAELEAEGGVAEAIVRSRRLRAPVGPREEQGPAQVRDLSMH